jgi:hypothetical protein
MAPKARKPATWIEVAVANGGFRKALKALTWAHSWGIVREARGHDPSADEVAAYWHEPRRTTFREQAAFRECFPTLDNPAPIFDSAAARSNLRRLADAAEQLERPNDASILQLGMGEATI